MLTKKLISLQHPSVLHWRKLCSDSAYREEAKRVLLVGEKTIRELSKEIPIEVLITLEDSPEIAARERCQVTESILKKITGLSQSDGFAAEVFLPEPRDLSKAGHLLILDGISDPGNLGTLLRSALAFGWEGVILTPGTVDLFNDKSLRASKGAPFHLPYQRMGENELVSFLQEKKIHAYTADLEGSPFDQLEMKPPLSLILSSEAKGPSPWADALGTKITIPMKAAVESLNVAASGSILLYAMRPS